MIFGGFNWVLGVPVPPKPADPTPTQHWSCLWTYTAGNQRRQITCGHLHHSEHAAKECAKIVVSHMHQYRNGTQKEVQPAIRILARARNVKFEGVIQEPDDLDQ
jgi:hypothetical protein